MIGSLIVPEWQSLLAEHEHRSLAMNPDEINDMFLQHLYYYEHRGFSNIMLLFRQNATSEREVYLFPFQSRDIVKYQHNFEPKGYNFEPRGHIINIQEYLQEIETYNNAPELLEKLDQCSCKP